MLAFPQCVFLVAHCGINLCEHDQRLGVFRMFANSRGRTLARDLELSRRFLFIAQSSRDNCLLPFARSKETIVVEFIAAAGIEQLSGTPIIPFLER